MWWADGHGGECGETAMSSRHQKGEREMSPGGLANHAKELGSFL